jgi:hypothetical protein
VKAADERNPARKVARSLALKDRTKIGSFMLPIIAQSAAFTTGLLTLH